MADRKINISIGSGFDSSGVQQASQTLHAFHSKLMESNKWLLQINAEMSEKMHALAQGIAVDFGAAADKTAKGFGRVYETLDQINARIDLPKKLAREHEELNNALKRYCELCEEARRREQARMDSWRSPKSQWNRGAGAGMLYKPGGAGGLADATPDIGKMSKSIVPALIAIDRMAGGLDGSLGKVARGLQGIIGLGTAFGPVGAAVGAGFAAIDMAASSYVDTQKKAIEKMREATKAMSAYWETAKNARFERDADIFNKLAESVANVADEFERAAQRSASLASVREKMEAAIGQTELLGMQGDMSAAVDAADQSSKGRVAAEWRLRIARREVELRQRASEIAADNEREALATAEKRVALAQRGADRLGKAEVDARAEYERVRNFMIDNLGVAKGEQDPDVQRAKSLWERARDAARKAEMDLEGKQAELEVMQKQADVNAVQRENDVVQARNAADAAARDHERVLRDAEVSAAKAAAQERDRLDRELHKKRMDDLRAEIAAQKDAANPLRATAAVAQSEFERAFAMYRDPTRAASEIAEERDRAADLKQLHRDATRYGGKWRIDELSALMSAGDSAGVQSRLEDWRKSRSFSPEVEAMVRASAAERTRTTVEDELRKIETNTSGLAQKLDELLKMKE